MADDRDGAERDDATTGGDWNTRGAGAAFLPIGIVFLVLGLTRDDSSSFTAIGIVFLALGVGATGSWWVSTRPAAPADRRRRGDGGVSDGGTAGAGSSGDGRGGNDGGSGGWGGDGGSDGGGGGGGD